MKKNLLVLRITGMIVGILLGALLLLLAGILTAETVAKIIHIGLIVYGILIIIGNVPSLVSGVANIHRRAGVMDLISAIIGIALGLAMIFYQGTFLVVAVAVYLIVFPLLRVLVADKKGEQFKRELLRLVLGVVLLVFVPALVNVAFFAVRLILRIAGWGVIALSVVLGVIEIIRIAIAKPASAPAEEPVYVDFEEKQD